MRIRPRWWGLLAVVALGPGCITVVERPDGLYERTYSREDHREILSPYGEWIYLPGYGQVWRPYRSEVGGDFMPYSSGGRWVYTEVGWVFESDWEWGYVPFHYGNWFFSRGHGWVWVPGSRWAPAWVSWRYGGGYVGWAPLPPYGYPYAHGYGYGYGYDRWCFVDSRYLDHRDVYRYRIDPAKARAIFHEATPVGNVRGQPVGPNPKSLTADVQRWKDRDFAGFDQGAKRGAKDSRDRWSPPPGKDSVRGPPPDDKGPSTPDRWVPSDKGPSDPDRWVPSDKGPSDPDGWVPSDKGPSDPGGWVPSDKGPSEAPPPSGKERSNLDPWAPSDKGPASDSEWVPPRQGRTPDEDWIPPSKGAARDNDAPAPRYQPPPSKESRPAAPVRSAPAGEKDSSSPKGPSGKGRR